MKEILTDQKVDFSDERTYYNPKFFDKIENNDEKYSKGKETCYEKRNLVYFYMKKDSTRKNYKQMRKKQDRKKM